MFSDFDHDHPSPIRPGPRRRSRTLASRRRPTYLRYLALTDDARRQHEQRRTVAASASGRVGRSTSTHHPCSNRELALLERLLTDHERKYWRQRPELLKAHELFYHVRAVTEECVIQEETATFPLIHAHEAGRASRWRGSPTAWTTREGACQHREITGRSEGVAVELSVPGGCGREGRLHSGLVTGLIG